MYLISQRMQIGKAEHGWVPDSRTALREQVMEQRYNRTTPKTILNNFSAFTDTIETSIKETEDSHLPRLRRSGRTKQIQGYYPDHEVDEDTNNDKLGVYHVPGIGDGKFAKKSFGIKNRVICVYHGNKISQKRRTRRRNNLTTFGN